MSLHATRPRSILLDTDIGSDVDDALALGLILASPEELDLVGITTVCGDTQTRARIAARILSLGGRDDVDVCAGERVPLLRPSNRFVWFGHEEVCAGDSGGPAISDEPAPERIVRASREVDGLEVVLIGPVTNLARALALDPELPERLAGITIMGGHIRRVAIGGHECPHGIDYNLCSDPEATVAVLGAGFRTTLVSADVTLRTWMNTADLEALERCGAVARLLAEQVRIWSPVQRKLFTGLGGNLTDDNEAFLHDPLTLLALIDPEPLHFETLNILATVEGHVLRTIEVPADSAAPGRAMQVATDVDAEAAARAIAERLQGL